MECEIAGLLFEAMFLKQKYYLMKLSSVIMQALLIRWQCHFLHAGVTYAMAVSFSHEVLLMQWQCHFLMRCYLCSGSVIFS